MLHIFIKQDKNSVKISFSAMNKFDENKPSFHI